VTLSCGASLQEAIAAIKPEKAMFRRTRILRVFIFKFLRCYLLVQTFHTNTNK
jgi:hypothetical protein